MTQICICFIVNHRKWNRPVGIKRAKINVGAVGVMFNDASTICFIENFRNTLLFDHNFLLCDATSLLKNKNPSRLRRGGLCLLLLSRNEPLSRETVCYSWFPSSISVTRRIHSVTCRFCVFCRGFVATRPSSCCIWYLGMMEDMKWAEMSKFVGNQQVFHHSTWFQEHNWKKKRMPNDNKKKVAQKMSGNALVEYINIPLKTFDFMTVLSFVMILSYYRFVFRLFVWSLSSPRARCQCILVNNHYNIVL